MEKNKILKIISQTKTFIRRTNGIPNTIFLEPRKGKKIQVAVMPISANTDKKVFVKVLGDMLRTGKYKSFVQVCEVCVTKLPLNIKCEGIMVRHETDIGDKQIWFIEVKNISGKVKFMKTHNVGDRYEGDMSKIW